MRLRADQALVTRGLAPSRARAQAEIKAGRVQANGRRLTRSSDIVPADAQFVLEDANPYVSRGALKLLAALKAFQIDPAGRDVLDLGASTGGFTQVALEYGARQVIAVDVGHGQLHPTLATDPRVRLIEGMNARDLTPESIGLAPGLVLADLSFISLTLGLAASLNLAARDAYLIALIKPQFEAGRQNIGKGGIVKDPGVHAETCLKIRLFLDAKGWTVIGVIDSPIIGGDGNKEFLIGAKRA